MPSRCRSGSAARLFAEGAADALRAAGDCLEAAAGERTGPYSGASPEELAAVDDQPRLRLAARPALGAVAFRYIPSPDDPARSDRLNEAIRLRLLAAGRAVVGRTEVDGRVHLKLTLLDPTTTEAEVIALVALVAATGAGLDQA